MANREMVEQIEVILRDMPKERSYLLPALWAVVDALGWIDEERTEAVADVLNLPVAEVYGVASFYALLPTAAEQPVGVCDDILCRMEGSQALMDALKAAGIPVRGFPCLGRCDKAPAALIGRDPFVQATPDQIIRHVRGEA